MVEAWVGEQRGEEPLRYDEEESDIVLVQELDAKQVKDLLEVTDFPNLSAPVDKHGVRAEVVDYFKRILMNTTAAETEYLGRMMAGESPIPDDVTVRRASCQSG